LFLICVFYNFHKATTRCLSLAVPAVKRKPEKAQTTKKQYVHLEIDLKLPVHAIILFQGIQN